MMDKEKELDPQVKKLLMAIGAAGNPPVETLPFDVARKMVDSGFSQMKIPVKPVFSIENRLIPGRAGDIKLRIYKPSAEKNLPVLLFIHGGGWVFFNAQNYDFFCSHICDETGCIVVSVDYRLSPEYKFPVALDECMDAVHWVADSAAEFGGDPSRIVVSGDSAGGNLAAATALRCRNEETPKLFGQVLIYPVTNHYDPPTPSMLKFSEGYNLTCDSLKWLWNQYLDEKTDPRHPYISPILADDLTHLPDALVMLSGFDPLHDEGLMYAMRLKESGCNVTLISHEEMIHGFISYLGYIDRAKDAISEISTWLRERFGI